MPAGRLTTKISCWEPLQIGEWLEVIVNTIQAIFIVLEKKRFGKLKQFRMVSGLIFPM